MKVIYKRLKTTDISLLNQTDSLYSLDFRATGEQLDYEIPAMWKYENILTTIVSGMNVTVNEDYQQLTNKKENTYCVAHKDKDKPSVPVIDRLNVFDTNIKNVINFIPHPSFDSYAQTHKLNLFYKYEDFLKYNNKVAQKNLLDTLTPKWGMLENMDKEVVSENYVKGMLGSGGYKVFAPTTFPEDLFKPDMWYYEEPIDGVSMSVQIIKEKDTYTVFGLTKQLIEEKKYFVGAEILPLTNSLTDKLKDFIENSLISLDSLIQDYEGFLGIDFVEGIDDFKFLEGNIRLTAMTIPTLFVNGNFDESKLLSFHEDVHKPQDNDIVMAIDTASDSSDVLRHI